MNIFSKMGLEKKDHASTFATRFPKGAPNSSLAQLVRAHDC